MTQLVFDELPPGSLVSLLALDRGSLSGLAVSASGAVTPADVGAILGASEANVVYVDKTGSAAGPGNRAQPYLTIQQAINAAKAAGATQANPWAVRIGIGTFSDPFLYEPGIWLEGQDTNLTAISNPNPQQLSPAFATPGTLDTGVQNAAIIGTFSIDFAAVGSAGQGRFWMRGCQLDIDISATGNNSTNRFFMLNVFSVLTNRTMTFSGLTVRCLGTAVLLNLVLNCTGSVGSNFFGDTFSGSVTINGTSGTNFAQYVTNFTAITNPIFTGDRISYSPGAASVTRVGGPDADTSFTSGTVVPGALHIPVNGTTIIDCGNTALRTYTFSVGSSSIGARVIVRANGNAPINVLGLNIPTVLDPGENGDWAGNVGGITNNGLLEQYGVATLVNGVSPVITMDAPAIAASSTPFAPHGVAATYLTGSFTYAVNASTAIGELLVVNINSGTRQAGTGNFQIQSRQRAAPGSVETGDQRTIFWRVKLARNF